MTVYFRSAAGTMDDKQSGSKNHRQPLLLEVILALICFDRETHKKCEEFDGSRVQKRATPKYSHRSSCLAIYDSKLIAVSSYLSDGRNKVETYSGSSWKSLADHPK